MTPPAVETRTFAAMDARLDPASPAPLAVAVSGGGDSMALLALADGWARGRGRRLHVLHLDHGLNPDSAAWAKWVRGQADGYGASCAVLRWTAPKPATGLPAAARAARHALLAQAARARRARVILMGHTADDAEEGDWMREQGVPIGRVRAWSPSPAWPEGRDLMLLRPLLEVRRAELRAWLTTRGLAWIEDPANLDSRFTRVRSRSALARAPERAVESPPDPDGAALTRLVTDAGAGVLAIDRAGLRAAGENRAATLLSVAVVCAAGGVRPPRGPALSRLLSRLRGAEPVSATLAGARMEAAADTVLIGRDPGRIGLPEAPAAPGRPLVWDGRFELEVDESGVVAPLSSLGARLSGPDLAQARRTPAPWRATLPVLRTPAGVRLLAARPLPFSRLRHTLAPPPREPPGSGPLNQAGETGG